MVNWTKLSCNVLLWWSWSYDFLFSFDITGLSRSNSERVANNIRSHLYIFVIEKFILKLSCALFMSYIKEVGSSSDSMNSTSYFPISFNNFNVVLSVPSLRSSVKSRVIFRLSLQIRTTSHSLKLSKKHPLFLWHPRKAFTSTTCILQSQLFFSSSMKTSPLCLTIF